MGNGSYRDRKRNGFTLAELLITVAIIAVLTALAAPIYSKILDKSRQAVDMTTMRAAKTALFSEMTTGMIVTDGETRYYYNAGSDTLSTERYNVGCGHSITDASEWWTGDGTASGVPNRNGKPAGLSLTVDSQGNVTYRWGENYTGLNVTKPSEYKSMNQKQKLELDEILIDSLQEEFRSMTYAQLRELVFDEKNKKRLSKDYYGYLTVNGTSYLCLKLSDSSVSKDGKVTTSSGQGIYYKQIFENVGFDTSLDQDETYVINSVPNVKESTVNTQTVWVNLMITENDLKNIKTGTPEAERKAATSYTYLKSGGADTPASLKESNRRSK